MTIIVVDRLNKNNFIMMGDRCLSDDTGYNLKDPTPKVKKIGNTLIGASGNATPMSVIMNMKEWEQLEFVPDIYNHLYYKLIPKINKNLHINELRELDKEDEGDTGLCDILICSQNQCFSLDVKTKGVELIPISVPIGIGCGWPNALGALSLLERFNRLWGYEYTTKEKLMHAVHATALCNNFCDDNIDVIIGGGKTNL